MYSKRGLLAFALIFCLFETVLSIKCYNCASTADGDCYKNPKNEVDCSKITGDSSTDMSSTTFFGQINKHLRDTGVAITTEYHCGTYLGVHVASNKSAIVRSCAPKAASCDLMKLIIATAHNFKIDSCDHCTTDYCNSSSSVQAGAFILGFSLLLTVLFSDKF